MDGYKADLYLTLAKTTDHKLPLVTYGHVLPQQRTTRCNQITESWPKYYCPDQVISSFCTLHYPNTAEGPQILPT